MNLQTERGLCVRKWCTHLFDCDCACNLFDDTLRNFLNCIINLCNLFNNDLLQQPPQDYILLIRCLLVRAFCFYAFCLTALCYSPLNARMHTVWPNRMHATCFCLTPTPLISCTGTCTPKLTPSGAQNAIDTTPLPLMLPTSWQRLPTTSDDIRRHPNDIRYDCRVEGVLVRPPNDKMGVERGGSMCTVCVWARVHAYVFAQTEFKQVGDH